MAIVSHCHWRLTFVFFFISFEGLLKNTAIINLDLTKIVIFSLKSMMYAISLEGLTLSVRLELEQLFWMNEYKNGIKGEIHFIFCTKENVEHL